MSRNGQIAIPWASGKHTFRLAIGQLEELQELCNAGPKTVLTRVHLGTWRVQDIRETLRLGLIGGGMKPMDAMLMVERYASDGMLEQNEGAVKAILSAAIAGSPDNEGESGENNGEATAATSPTAS